MSNTESQEENNNFLSHPGIIGVGLPTPRLANIMNAIIDSSIDDLYLQAAINQSLTESINTRQDNISLNYNCIKYSKVSVFLLVQNGSCVLKLK